MGRMAFVIDTHESLNTGAGYLATRYDAIFRNPQTNEVTQELQFEDTYEPVGNYYIMTHQVVHSIDQGKKTTTEFNFSNIKLLEPAMI